MRPDLPPQEAAVLKLIQDNPFIGQQEIADALGLARSTVAAHIVQLVQKGYILGRGYVLPEASRIVCLGGAVFDRKYRARQPLVPETSNPVDGMRSYGGVARNVAENLGLLGAATSFISILGDDETGNALLAHLRQIGVDVSQVLTSRERPTAEYAAILDQNGDLSIGLADMGIFDLFEASHLERVWPHLASASLVFCDCNLPAETLRLLIERRKDARFRLAFDAVSTHKVMRLPDDLSGIDYLFMNLDEANALMARRSLGPFRDAEAAALAIVNAGVAHAIVTRGASGAVVAEGGQIRAVPAVKAEPVEMTGAGDAMIAGALQALLTGKPAFEAVRIGTLLGALTTESAASVHPELSPRFLEANMHRLQPVERI
ncbi:carbohydrate kinase [Rhizobium sp. FKY42]|uniref:carbohydrate kinase n=1 Tax=Rhizobium sp. FKY42 TaxID=2562310 RepID=UPI0010BFA79D|nr:carbohydrate kinase [Rhizobium sp. FKY42]